jgi:hypothetical protein
MAAKVVPLFSGGVKSEMTAVANFLDYYTNPDTAGVYNMKSRTEPFKRTQIEFH